MEVLRPGVVDQDVNVFASWRDVGHRLVELPRDWVTVALDRSDEVVERVPCASTTGRLVAAFVLRGDDEHQVGGGGHLLEPVLPVVAEDVKDVLNVGKPLWIYWEIHAVAQGPVHGLGPSVVMSWEVPFSVIVDAVGFVDVQNGVGHIRREGLTELWLSAQRFEVACVDVARPQPRRLGAGGRKLYPLCFAWPRAFASAFTPYLLWWGWRLPLGRLGEGGRR